MKIDWLKIRKGLWRGLRFVSWLAFEWLLDSKPKNDDKDNE